MIQHTLILTVPLVKIPETNILEFAKQLIAANLVNIDYFGIELDNGDDYIDEEKMKYLVFEYEKLSVKIHNFIAYLNKKDFKGTKFIDS